MAQTRLQKLELLRKALETSIKQLFPDEGDFSVKINLYDGSQEFMDEARKEGFLDHNNEETFWLKKAEITIFRK